MTVEAFLVALATNPAVVKLLVDLLSSGKVTAEDATKALLALEVQASDAEMKKEFGLGQ